MNNFFQPHIHRIRQWYQLLAIVALVIIFFSPLLVLGSGIDDEPEAPPIGRMMHKQNRLEIIKMLAEVKRQIDGGGDEKIAAKQFYEKLASMGSKSPMVELNQIKTSLGEQRNAILGNQFEGGGTPVEKALLGYRRDVTFEAIRQAVADVKNKLGPQRIMDSSVFLAKIGKWTRQKAEMMVFAGDIDFSFVGADPVVIQELTSSFKKSIKQLTGLDMVALDSVATAHGFAEHMVYIGEQGRKYGDDAIMQMGKEGIEKINFSDPYAVGRNRPDLATTGEVAMWTVVLEETIRKNNGTMTDFSQIDRNWQQRRNQIVEPFLSMEMVRHLEGDIIANMDVFKAIDLAKKGSKYFRRSNDQLNADLALPSSDPALSEFARRLDDMAKTASADELAGFVATESKKIGMPFFDITFKNGRATLQISPGNAGRFLEKIKQSIWKNVANGFDARIRTLLEVKNTEGDSRMSSESNAEQMRKTLEMLADGLRVMNQEGIVIPHEIKIKMEVLTKLVASHHATRAYGLPATQIEELHKLLEQAGKSPNLASRLLLVGTVISQVDKYITKHYDLISSRLPGSHVMDRAGAKIDALNSILDGMDNVLLTGLRNDGVIKYDTGYTDEQGRTVFSTVAAFPKIAAINHRLNNSILGRIGNNTAFKGINLYQEGDAYYQAFANASSPSEAFENLAVEIFRRRVPAGAAIEAYMMENYLRMGVEIIYTIFPPLAIPEGIYGMAESAVLSVETSVKSVYWNSELELLVDKLYAQAKFKQINKPNREIEFVLQSVKYNKAVFHRAELLSPTSKFIADNDVNDILTEKLRDAGDPLLEMYGVLKKHELTGEKLAKRYEKLEKQQWAKVKSKFINRMIERLEKRKSAEQLIDFGEVDKKFAELMKIAKNLEIEVSIERNIDEKFDGSVLQTLWKVMVAGKRELFNQPVTQSELNRLVAIMIDYINAYRKVLLVRKGIESEIDGWFSGSNLNYPSQKKHYGLRVLTGVPMLTGDVKADLDIARYWRARPKAIVSNISARLGSIKSVALGKKSVIEGDFDNQILIRISYKQMLIDLFKMARVPVISGKSTRERFNLLKGQKQKLIEEFKQYYGAGDADPDAGELIVMIVSQPGLETDVNGIFVLPANKQITLFAEVSERRIDGEVVDADGKIKYQWGEGDKLLGNGKSLVIDNSVIKPGMHKIIVTVSKEIMPVENQQLKSQIKGYTGFKEGSASYQVNIEDPSKLVFDFEDHLKILTARDSVKLRLKQTVGDRSKFRYTWKRDGRIVLDKMSFDYLNISDFKGLEGKSVKFTVEVFDNERKIGTAETVIKVIKSKADSLIEEGKKFVEQDRLQEALEKFEESLKLSHNQQIENYIETIKKELTERDAEDQTDKKSSKLKNDEKSPKTEKDWIEKIERIQQRQDWQMLLELDTKLNNANKRKYHTKFITREPFLKPEKLLSRYLKEWAEEKWDWFKKDVYRYIGKINSLISMQDPYNKYAGTGNSLSNQDEICRQQVKKILKIFKRAEKEHKTTLNKMFNHQGSSFDILSFINDFLNRFDIPDTLVIPEKYKHICKKMIDEKFSIKLSGGSITTPNEIMELHALVIGGSEPVKIRWSGENISPQEDTAIFLSGKSGNYSVNVTATDMDGKTTSDNITIIVMEVPELGLQTSVDSVYYGQSVALTVTGDKMPVEETEQVVCGPEPEDIKNGTAVWMPSPTDEESLPPWCHKVKIKKSQYEFIWQTDMNGVEFDPPSGHQASVRAMFANLGKAEIWAQVRKAGTAIMETDPVTVNVLAPNIKIKVKPSNPKIAEECKAIVKITPDIDNKYLTFRWPPAGKNIQKLLENDDDRMMTFKLKDIKPVTIEVQMLAQAPYYGGELGVGRIKIMATEYKVDVKVLNSLDTKPMIWKEGKGLVKADKEIAVHQNVRLKTIITPKPKIKVRYEWKLNENSHFAGGSSGSEIVVNRSQTGHCIAKVTIKDNDGTILGRGSGSFPVTISQQQINNGKEKDQKETHKLKEEVRKLWKEGQSQWHNGLLNKAVATVKKATGIDPSNRKIAKVLKGMQGQKRLIDAALKETEKYIGQNKFKKAKRSLEKVGIVSKNYPPYVEMRKRLKLAKQKAVEHPSAKQDSITIISATYGGNCGITRGNVTSHIAKECNGKYSCMYTINYKKIGDPAVGCRKTYSVQYRCGNNPQVFKKSLAAEAGWGDKFLLLNCQQKNQIDTAEPTPATLQEIDKTRPMLGDSPNAVIIKNPKVNGVALDYCRDWAKNCGKPAADAWCQANGYDESIDHIMKENAPPTRVISTGKICNESLCDRIIEIKCRKEIVEGTAKTRVDAMRKSEEENKGAVKKYKQDQFKKEHEAVADKSSNTDKPDVMNRIFIATDKNVYPDPAVGDELANSDHYVIDGNESHAWVRLFFRNSALNSIKDKTVKLKLTISTVKDGSSRDGMVIYCNGVVVGRIGAVARGEVVEIPLDVRKIKIKNGTLELILKAAGNDAAYIESKISGQGAELKIIIDSGNIRSKTSSPASIENGLDSLRIPNNLFEPGEEIALSFTALPNYPAKSWIGMFKADLPHAGMAKNNNHELAYKYLAKNRDGKFTFTSPTREGVYDSDKNYAMDDRTRRLPNEYHCPEG